MENGVDQDVIVDGVKNVRINSSGKLLQDSIFCMTFVQFFNLLDENVLKNWTFSFLEKDRMRRM